jgi:fibronectin-binding autotransporter adhesin
MYRPVERYVRAFGVATLLVAACLAPLPFIGSVTPAFADGGAGGSSGGHAGGTGATGFSGQTGGTGVTDGIESGGGGGGGAGGGTGGDGGTTFGIVTGGAGGTAGVPNGQTGTAGGPNNGPGGGGGGYNGNGAGTATIGGTSLTGGNGGGGGAGAVGANGGGGGGAGGYGAIVTGSGTSTVNDIIQGGIGGAGGNATYVDGQGGGGGDGGVGVQFTTSGATISIGSGTVISGGAGGVGGPGNGGNGANGAGGVGIVGSGLTIIDSGTVRGGLGGDGTTRANAITFSGGTNLLELQRGVGFSGNAVVTGGTGTLQLGGGIDNNLDVSGIGSLGSGAQYQGFSSFTKTGGSTWTLSNTTATTTSWAINQGALSISADNNLGAAAGGLSFDGGKLETTATLSTARTITLNSGGGTFQVDTGTTTLSGAIGGPGGLSKLGTGTLTITNSGNTYSGLTQINAGTLALTGGGTLAQSSGVFVGAGSTFDISGTTTGATIQDLTGGTGSAVALGAKTLTVGTSNSTTYAGDISGVGGSLVKQGSGTLTLNGLNTYSGGTTVSAGTLEGTTSSLQGTITNNATVSFNQAANGSYGGAIGGSGAVNVSGGRTITFTGSNGYTGATTVNANTTLALTGAGTFNASSGLDLSAAGATFDISASTGAPVIKDLSGVAGTVINLGGRALAVGGTSDTSFAGAIEGVGGVFVKNGSGTLTLSGANTYSGQTTIGGGILQAGAANTFSATSQVSVNTGTLDLNNFDNAIKDLTGNLGTSVTLGSATLTINGASSLYNGVISGTGGLTITGGTQSFSTSAQLYTGATVLNGGSLKLNDSASIAQSSGLTLAASGGIFDISNTTSGTTIKDLSGVAGTTVALGGKTLTFGTTNSTTFAGTTTGNGALIKQGSGTFSWSGNGDFGSFEVAAGQLTATGNLTGNVTVDAGAKFLGTATITGNLTVNGTIRPDIGTTNVIGTYTQGAGSTYQVEVTPGGLSDKINVTGNAVINGGTVAVMADAGTYSRSTRYTILTASTGVTGTYASVTSNFAFLTPTLSYDANDVFLTLLNTTNAFRNGAQTPNQAAVGAALDTASPSASGDFANVLNALYSLSTAQGPAALDALGGQNYSGFSSLTIQSALLFMDSFSSHAGGGLGTGGSASLPGGSTWQALKVDTADACGEACDVEPLWGAWGGGMGAFGTVAGDSNGHGLTYNLGGFVAGLDRKFVPGFRAGVAAGFNAATLYTQGMPGTGTSNTLQFALYGEYAPGPFYLDALGGYGHSDNRMNRPIVIAGLPFRMAQGYTTANTFFGQLEAGYKVMIAPSFGGFAMPFARLQASTSTQAGFSETGADSLDLTVAQRTTNSLRTVLGAQLGAGVDAPWHEKLDLVFLLGWSHEFADQTRPVTAAFAGAPAISFTTFGAQAPRDGVVLGLGAKTQVAEHTSVYLRYDGDLAGANTNHVLNAGVRYVW